jgi:inner membrane protein YidH
MSTSQSDPRVFFAAERTLLAWIRTSLTIMALGFVIARFGLFIQLMSLQAPAVKLHVHSGLSSILGIFFIVMGALTALAATVFHRRFISTLSPSELPASYSTNFAVSFGFLIGFLGLCLTGYLLIS